MGCSGRYGEVRTQSESDAKATEKELFNNWSEYNVYINRSNLVVRLKGPSEAGAIVFASKMTIGQSGSATNGIRLGWSAGGGGGAP